MGSLLDRGLPVQECYMVPSPVSLPGPVTAPWKHALSCQLHSSSGESATIPISVFQPAPTVAHDPYCSLDQLTPSLEGLMATLHFFRVLNNFLLFFSHLSSVL